LPSFGHPFGEAPFTTYGRSSPPGITNTVNHASPASTISPFSWSSSDRVDTAFQQSDGHLFNCIESSTTKNVHLISQYPAMEPALAAPVKYSSGTTDWLLRAPFPFREGDIGNSLAERSQTVPSQPRTRRNLRPPSGSNKYGRTGVPRCRPCRRHKQRACSSVSLY
jgi:hypothetical protein